MTPAALSAYLHKTVIIELQNATELTGNLGQNSDGSYSVHSSSGSSTPSFQASDVQTVREA
ncbi:MAG TPA: hypothetical protein VHR97_10945 [Candidatus Baltobacteraceae bacterium]|jgi:small nuclear ribonucleoprotein (snRNP)-like protein|nr:hypothetical protein [Candidatus Baltobacteraceae bacterium]